MFHREVLSFVNKKISSLILAASLVFANSNIFINAQQTAPTTPPAPSGQMRGSTKPTTEARNSTATREAGSASSGVTMTTVEQDFSEALSVVEDNYVEGNKIDYNQVFKASIIGMLRTLDPHSNYFDAKEFEELRTEQQSEYYGIGASIRDYRIGDNTDTYVTSTFATSPAFRGGVRYGDRIVAVDGVQMRGKGSSEVRDKIRGPRGTVVKITLERAATKQLETVEITRDRVEQPSIPDAYLIRPGVGYVNMSGGFNSTTADELEAALERLRTKGMTSLVLDLRGNPGGFLDQSVRVSSKFLQRGQVVLTQKGRSRGGERVYRADNNGTEQVPLVVLINRGSASASEIVAGALQDHDRAFIVGENSFGKGLVQSIYPLEYGAGLTLTSAKYYTPSGRLIQREYAGGSLYDYYTPGGVGASNNNNNARPATPTGPESRTDSGRVVYGGGGITPDETVKPRTTTEVQARFFDPSFAFVRELANGRIVGLETYKVQRAIDYTHELQATDLVVNDAVLQAFKAFLAQHKEYRLTPAQIDANREFVARQIRFDLATAAYGTNGATRVLLADDPQVAKAVEAMPRARQLAATATGAQKSYEE